MERILILLTTLFMLLIPGEREESEIKIPLQGKEDILTEEQVQETIIASEETIEEIQTLAESEVTEESDALAHYACYVVRLKDIMKYPDNYWGLWSSINITEHNQFAIEDINGDGIVHIWYEEPDNIPVEAQYISEEEYQERLAAIRKGKEQIDIFWYQITERNIEDIIYNQLYKESHAWVSGKESWPYAYKYFLDNKWNLCDLLMEQNEAGMYGYIQGFYLHDMDKDGVPELFVSKAFSSTYIYTYTDEGLELRSVIPYDSFSDEVIGYDMRDGQAYIYYADAGTSPTRGTGIYKVLLPEEEFTEEMRSFDYGRESVYGATYGEMDLDNGEYVTIKWEDAIMQDDATGEKKEAFLKMNYKVAEHTPIISSFYQKVYFCMDEMTVYSIIQ